jgi:DNA replication protein DnaC
MPQHSGSGEKRDLVNIALLVFTRLPVGKTLASFDFDTVPMVSKAQVMALTSGDSWIEKGANLLLFGPPGAGKSHLAAAIGLALVENGWRVLFTRPSALRCV